MSLFAILSLLAMVVIETGGSFSGQSTHALYASDVLAKDGCSGCYVNGVCYLANQQWKNECWTLQCQNYGYMYRNNGYQIFRRSVPVKTQCKDSYGKCVDNGHDGVIDHRRCTCHVTGSLYTWKCKYNK